MIEEKNCGNCKFSKEKEEFDDRRTMRTWMVLNCHKYPPNEGGFFPLIKKETWCGCYEQKGGTS